MKRKLALIGLLALALAAMPILASCTAEETPTPTPTPTPEAKWIDVANLCNLTGPPSANDPIMKMLLSDYFEYVNDKGGIKGAKGTVKVRVEHYDTQYSVPKGKEAWKRLEAKDTVAVWCNLGALIEGLYPDAENDQIPFVCASIGIQSVWSDYVFMTSHNGFPNCTATWILGMIEKHKKAGKEGMPKVGGIGPDIGPAIMFFMGIDEWAPTVGIDKVPREFFPVGATDVSPQLLRLQDQGVEYVYNFSSPATQIVIIETMERLGMDMTSDVLFNCGIADIIKIGGKEIVEGQFATYWFEPLLLAPEFPVPEGTKLVKGIWEDKHPGEMMQDSYVFGTPATLILEEAIRLALDEVSPEELTGETLKVHGFERIKDFDCGGIRAPVTYEKGVLPHGESYFKFYTVRDGYVHPDTDWIKCPQIIPQP